MKRRIAWLTAALAVALMLLSVASAAGASGAVHTTVTMRVSRMTQSAVVKAGEDLSIEVAIDGVTPKTYQWSFNGEEIEGAKQKVLNIEDAKVENAGAYRLEAFDEDGAMLVSMDIAVRVIDDTVPQSGDDSLPVGMAFAGMGMCAIALAALLRRRALL